MAVLNARNVAAKQTGALFDVTLREVLLFANGSEPITDHHSVKFSRSVCRWNSGLCQWCSCFSFLSLLELLLESF